MGAYVVMPKSVECGDDLFTDRPDRLDVIASDDGPVDTGLLDQFGNRIGRRLPRVPLGFCR